MRDSRQVEADGEGAAAGRPHRWSYAPTEVRTVGVGVLARADIPFYPSPSLPPLRIFPLPLALAVQAGHQVSGVRDISTGSGGGTTPTAAPPPYIPSSLPPLSLAVQAGYWVRSARHIHATYRGKLRLDAPPPPHVGLPGAKPHDLNGELAPEVVSEDLPVGEVEGSGFRSGFEPHGLDRRPPSMYLPPPLPPLCPHL